MAMTESVPEFIFVKSLVLPMGDNGQVYDGFCGKNLPWFKVVMESVLREASGLSYK